MRIALLFLSLVATTISPCSAVEWLTSVPLEHGRGTYTVPADRRPYFLEFGDHSFAPDAVSDGNGDRTSFGERLKSSIPIGLFQQLRATTLRVPEGSAGTSIQLTKDPSRDAFWDQIIVVEPETLGHPLRYELIESGTFGAELPAAVRDQTHSQEEIRRQRESLVDPVIPQHVAREVSWQELESAAFPLDFQKVLLASRNDANPAFAYQNGQWFTTWISHDLPKWTKEDHWFAPALLVGKKLVRPAPLSATTEFVTAETGVTLPLWKLRWQFGEATVTQWLFSYRTTAKAEPATYVRFQMENCAGRLEAGTRFRAATQLPLLGRQIA